MSKKFPEYKGLDLPKVAEEILSYWEENEIFKKKASRLVKAKSRLCSLKGRHLPMVCREFTT